MIETASSAREPFWQATFQDPIATFTFVLVAATIVLAISTGLLWWTTRRLAIDTKESGEIQADKMERSASAMENVARSMEINARQIIQSVDLQRRYGQMQLRPYLTVLVGTGILQTPDLRFEVRPKILNTGHTPARDVRWRIGLKTVDPDHYDAFAFPLPDPVRGGNMIAPHQDYSLSAVLAERVSDEDAVKIASGVGDPMLVVYGYVSYRDAMRRRYFTTFAQQVWWDFQRDKEGNVTGAPLVGRFLYKHNRAN